MSFSCWAEPQKMFGPNQITGPDPGIWDIYFIFSPSYGFDPGLFPLCNDGLHSWALSPGGILPLTRQNWIFCLVCVFPCTWHPGVCWSGHLICHLCGLCSWPQGIRINMSHKPLWTSGAATRAPGLLIHCEKLSAFIWNREMGLVCFF